MPQSPTVCVMIHVCFGTSPLHLEGRVLRLSSRISRHESATIEPKKSHAASSRTFHFQRRSPDTRCGPCVPSHPKVSLSISLSYDPQNKWTVEGDQGVRVLVGDMVFEGGGRRLAVGWIFGWNLGKVILFFSKRKKLQRSNGLIGVSHMQIYARLFGNHTRQVNTW